MALSSADQSRELKETVAALAARPLDEPTASRMRDALSSRDAQALLALRRDCSAGGSGRGQLRVVSTAAGEPARGDQDAPPAAPPVHRPDPQAGMA
jgi:hypothetical protein